MSKKFVLANAVEADTSRPTVVMTKQKDYWLSSTKQTVQTLSSPPPPLLTAGNVA